MKPNIFVSILSLTMILLGCFLVSQSKTAFESFDSCVDYYAFFGISCLWWGFDKLFSIIK